MEEAEEEEAVALDDDNDNNLPFESKADEFSQLEREKYLNFATSYVVLLEYECAYLLSFVGVLLVTHQVTYNKYTHRASQMDTRQRHIS